MNFVIILLTAGLILTCLFLILLVLVQLPKKEAGLGQAFGSGATDALFGPGSGNMLTKLTKWSATVFFALTLLIWILQGHTARSKTIDPNKVLTAAEKAAIDNPTGRQAAPTINTNLPGTNALTNSISSPATSTVPASPK